MTALRTARFFFGLLTLLAIVRQLAIHIGHGYDVFNFFSYFTNLSNMFAAGVLLFNARARTEPDTSRLNALLRGMAVVDMTVVGVVFAILLRNADLGSLLPWVNILLHYVMPVIVLIDWFWMPPAIPLGVPQMLACQLFPVLYLAYTMVRGAYTGWYPYPFLNPATAGGYAGVAVYVVCITLIFVIGAVTLFTLANRRRSAMNRSAI